MSYFISVMRNGLKFQKKERSSSLYETRFGTVDFKLYSEFTTYKALNLGGLGSCEIHFEALSLHLSRRSLFLPYNVSFPFFNMLILFCFYHAFFFSMKSGEFHWWESLVASPFAVPWSLRTDDDVISSIDDVIASEASLFPLGPGLWFSHATAR